MYLWEKYKLYVVELFGTNRYLYRVSQVKLLIVVRIEPLFYTMFPIGI